MPKPVAPTGLKRIETSWGHKYTLDGKDVPGVTTLLGKGLAKPALPYWSAKVVAEYVIDHPEGVDHLRTMGRGPAVAALKKVPWQKRDDAAVRGTDVHRIAEELLHGREVEVPSHLAGFVDGYVHWLDAFQVEPVLTEFSVASRSGWYAGTCDAIVRIGDTTWGLDWKTSSNVYGSTALQVAAYVKAEFYVDLADEVYEERQIPQVDRIGVVHVTEQGSTLRPFRDLDAAWRDWRHVAYVATAVPRIEAQLLDPELEPIREVLA